MRPGGARRAVVSVAFAAAVSVGLAGCGGGSKPTDAATATSCPELMTRAGRVLDGIVRGLGSKDAEALRAANPDDPFGALTAPFAAFEQRAAELGCDRAELRRLACESYKGVRPQGPAAEQYLARVTESCR
jgi:hypothetical protein